MPVAEYIKSGKEKLDNKKYREAIFDFNNALTFDPNNTESLILRGISKAGLGNKQESIDDFNKALKIDPQKHSCVN